MVLTKSVTRKCRLMKRFISEFVKNDRGSAVDGLSYSPVQLLTLLSKLPLLSDRLKQNLVPDDKVYSQITKVGTIIMLFFYRS